MSINNLNMIKQKISVFLAICFFLGACTGIKSNNGYMPVKDNIDKLKVNVTSTSSAKNILGEPALILGNREPIFVYSAQITDRVMFFQPKVISRNVLVLYFNKKKKLKKLDTFDLNDGKYVDLSSDNTDLKDKERSLLSSIFSNVGMGGVRVMD
jgi:outer membrane protein assembly factor BamE (lipoprotein component of BamABCDE complex)